MGWVTQQTQKQGVIMSKGSQWLKQWGYQERIFLLEKLINQGDFTDWSGEKITKEYLNDIRESFTWEETTVVRVDVSPLFNDWYTVEYELSDDPDYDEEMEWDLNKEKYLKDLVFDETRDKRVEQKVEYLLEN